MFGWKKARSRREVTWGITDEPEPEPLTDEPDHAGAEGNADVESDAESDAAADTAATAVTAATDNAHRSEIRRRLSRRLDRRRNAVRGIPLRVWLVVIIAFISGGGLIASSVTVSSIMRDFVYSSVDADLRASLSSWADNSEVFSTSQGGQRPPSEYVVMKIFPDGSMIVPYNSDGLPDLDQIDRTDVITTVGSDPESGLSGRWRVISQQDNGILTVVGKYMENEDNIIARLGVVQAIISLIVLVLMAILAYVFTYSALRPLREVERTAQKIAEGDIDRRVPQWPINTEVGRVAFVLNVMLEQLQHSLEESRSKEAQMRRFVGDASHELRTPLTSIRGYAELYRSGAVKDPDMVLSKIDAESKRMSLLVEDLLALTRAEGQRLERKDVDLLELSLSVAGSARAAFPGRTIEVCNATSDIPVVKGDSARLHQVLLNLVTNGLRHGGEEATVTIRLAFEGEKTVLVQIIDDGMGMTPQDAAHIFERFYRADTSRARSTGGSGLGLAITKSLVEAHGGEITVESQPGEGATFTIRLPRLVEAEG